MNTRLDSNIKISKLLRSPQVWAAYFFGICSALIAALFASIAGPVFKLIQTGVPDQGVEFPGSLGPLLKLLPFWQQGQWIEKKDFLWLFPVCLLGLGAAKFVCQWIHNLLSLAKGEQVSHAVRQTLLRSFFMGSSKNIDSTQYQEKQKMLLQFFGKELRDIMNLIMNVYISTPIQAFLAVLLLILLFKINFMYLCIVLLVAPCLAVAARYFRKKIPKRQTASLESSSRAITWLQARMQGIETVKHHATESVESALFAERLAELEYAETRLARTESRLNPTVEWIAVLASSALLGVVLLLKSNYEVDSDAFFSFLACLAMLGQVAGRLGRQYSYLLRSKVALARLTEAQQTFEQGAKNTNARVAKNTEPCLKASDLSLCTPTGKVIASGIDCAFAPGKLHALLGASGVGKSTLLKALTGNWPWTNKGAINVPDSVTNIFYLPQKFVPGPLSLKKHLDDASRCNAGELRKMIELAEAEQIPQALDKLSGDEWMLDVWHKSLSGGELQRISLAKIMRPLQNSLVLVDEGFSAMPPAQELRILQRLYALLDPSSIYLFSMHSRSNLKLFDHVWELKKEGLSEWKASVSLSES
jgi:ABC-type multidrug transport system fused ATPase/permease subunit